jgi:hypothetical protein
VEAGGLCAARTSPTCSGCASSCCSGQARGARLAVASCAAPSAACSAAPAGCFTQAECCKCRVLHVSFAAVQQRFVPCSVAVARWLVLAQSTTPCSASDRSTGSCSSALSLQRRFFHLAEPLPILCSLAGRASTPSCGTAPGVPYAHAGHRLCPPPLNPKGLPTGKLDPLASDAL